MEHAIKKQRVESIFGSARVQQAHSFSSHASSTSSTSRQGNGNSEYNDALLVRKAAAAVKDLRRVDYDDEECIQEELV